MRQDVDVSAWGPGVFSDDTTCDIRDEYRALIEDGVDDDAAASAIVERWSAELGPDEMPALWLALALAQSKVGRLQDDVRDRALEAVDDQYLVAEWASVSSRDGARRREALGKARAALTGPQPARRTLRRPKRFLSDLAVGDVLARPGPTPPQLWLVIGMYDERDGRDPWIRRLAWSAADVPDRRDLEALAAVPGFPVFHPGAEPHLATTSTTGDGWAEAGFVLVARGLVGAADPRGEYLSGSLGEWARVGDAGGDETRTVAR
jgi:hypothetical protein